MAERANKAVICLWMLSLEKCVTILKQYDYKIDNDTLKELRDYLYSIASIQIMNEDSEADINHFINNSYNN